MDDSYKFTCNNYTLNIITNYNNSFEEYKIIIIYYKSNIIAYVNIVLPFTLILSLILDDLIQIFQNTTQTKYISQMIYNVSVQDIEYNFKTEPGMYEHYENIESNILSFDNCISQTNEYLKIHNILKKLNI